jgi:hypothetical protein
VDAGPTAATDSFTQMMKAWTEAFTRFSGERANSRSPIILMSGTAEIPMPPEAMVRQRLEQPDLTSV